MTIEEFGKTIKAKYPQYNDISDGELGTKMLAKYPQYTDMVNKPVSQQKRLDQENAKATGAFFPANTENPSKTGEALKILGNLPGSAWNFAKNAVSFLNPENSMKNIGATITGLKEASQELGAGKTALEFAKALPGGVYEAAVPQAARDVITAGVGGLQYAFSGGDKAKEAAALQKSGEALQNAQRNIVNDPFGQIAPVVLGAKYVAEKGGVGPQFDKAITKTVDVATKPITAPIKAAGRGLNVVAEGTTAAVTGLERGTIQTIKEQPGAFSKKNQGLVDRPSLGTEVADAITKRTDAIAETGADYQLFRDFPANVKVDKNFIPNTIKEVTGVDFKNGKFQTSGGAKIRDASDVRAIQHLYDLWQPIFKKGEMTTNEYLNFRSDLAGLAKFERQVGKSQPIENSAKIVRAKFNENYRNQIAGLEEADANFAAQTKEFGELSKGLVDRNGNLTDAAVNKIANATGKGKDAFLGRLEELSPGITKKVQVLKAIEDIERASGIKVGTYTRGALQGGGGLGIGYAVAGIPGAIIGSVITAIITAPKNAVSIIRSYGLLKNAAALRAISDGLRNSGRMINASPGAMLPVNERALENAVSTPRTNFGRMEPPPKAKGVIR